jgi:hypothetical protein
MAVNGLTEIGVSSGEANKLIQVIEHRLSTKQTGSVWQLKRLQKLQEKHDKPEALRQMMIDYMLNSDVGMPVSEWSY